MHKHFLKISMVLFFSITTMAAEVNPSNNGESLIPGAWEVTQLMSGGPMGDKKEVLVTCYSAEDLRKDSSAPITALPNQHSDSQDAPKCSVTDVVMKSSAVSYTMNCDTRMDKIKVRAAGTYSSKEFATVGKTRMGFFTLTRTATGKYMGACSENKVSVTSEQMSSSVASVKSEVKAADTIKTASGAPLKNK